MSDTVIFIAVPLILLKIGIWICCCYARNKRQSHLNQQGVIVCRPVTAVIQPSVMRQGDRNGLTANELPYPVTYPQYGFQNDGHASQYTDRNGLIANELPTPMTSPQYGFQAEGHLSQYMDCTGMTQDKHPTTNSFPRDSFQPQSPIHAPPTYEEALKSGPV